MSKNRLVALLALVGLAVILFLQLQTARRGEESATGVTIEDLVLEADLRNEYGRIQGEFRVKARLLNRSPERLDRVKLLIDQLANNDRYPRLLPDRRSQVRTAGPLPPGEAITVDLGTFRPFHPELDQEIVVNVLSDQAQPGSVRKLPYLSAFPPGTND